ncbi:hypothetical protein AHAS_Ahas12G0154800 [Arachis hypogaea]
MFRSLCRVEQKESVRSSVSMVKDFPDLGRRMQEQRLACRLLWVARDNLRISPETTLTSYAVPPFGRKDR